MLSFVIRHRSLLSLIVKGMVGVYGLSVAYLLRKRQQNMNGTTKAFMVTIGITLIAAAVFLFFITLKHSTS